jgi:hypothetical protein
MRKPYLKPFLKSLDRKKTNIISALKVRNEMMLLSTIREVDVAGLNIGFPRLSMLVDHLVRIIKPQMSESEWREVESYARQVLSILDLILYEYK